MKRLRPNWVNGQDETQTELDAAAEAEQGLEELADLFATELHELQQQAAPSTVPLSRRKKSRKQLVTVDFGSQDVGGNPTDGDSNAFEKADAGVDLVTPPWLQPKTPKTTPKDSSPTAAVQQGGEHPPAAHPAAAAAGAVHQAAGAATQHKRAPQHTLPAHATPPAPAARFCATEHTGQEDVICDDSSDDFEPPSSCRRSGLAPGKQPGSSRQRPGSTRKTAAAGAAHASTPASAGGVGRTGHLLDALLGSTQMADGGPHQQHQQQQRHLHQQQQQYHQQQQQQEGGCSSYTTPAGGGEWVPPKSRTQAMQGPAGPHTAYGQDSMQQQQPRSSFRPPGLLERQRPAAGGVFGAAQQQQGSYPNSGADHGSWGPPLGGGCMAAGVRGDDGEPWWMTVLPDFVPVEVLLQAQVNPRDGATVFINYKSQFKDGGTAAAAAAPRGRKAAGAGTATRQPKGRGRKGSAAAATAAAAAAGGRAGFMSAAQWDQQGGSGGQGSKGKGRSRRSRKGKAGSGGGSSSGGRKRQGWRTVGGKKVFVSGSSRLTGAQAWKAYKGSSGNS